MAEELRVFPPKPCVRPRYRVPVGGWRWTPIEQVAVFPLLLGSPGPRDHYGRVCVGLCDVLDRVPEWAPDPEDKRSHEEKLMAESIALIEMRTVTRVIDRAYTESETVHAAAREVCGEARAGRPLTWGEKRLLREWDAKPDNGRDRVPLSHLLAFMRRPPTDEVLLRSFVRTLDRGADDPPTGPDPGFGPRWRTEAGIYLAAVVNSGPGTHRRRASFERLCAFAGFC